MSDTLAVGVVAGQNLPAGRWQNLLADECLKAGYSAPVYNIVSDRRGGRTAWSATVTVNNQNIPARYWYDGQFLNNAKEDAAEVAWYRVFKKTGPPSSLANVLVEQCWEKREDHNVCVFTGSDIENQKKVWQRKLSRSAFMLLVLGFVLMMVAGGLGISLHLGSLKLNGMPTWL